MWQSRTIGLVGFSRAELESFVGATVPDLIGPGLRLLFVGINPGLWTAATQTHFAHPGNRFFPALLEAGIIDGPKATMGEQPEPFEGSRLFVVPNPSGLNAHETTSTLAVAYRDAALAAGVIADR